MSIYFSAFRLSREDIKHNELLNETNKIQADLDNNDELNDRVIQGIEDGMQIVEDDMKVFNVKESIGNYSFAYWVKFLFELYPVMRDLTRSHREGNWILRVCSQKGTTFIFRICLH